MTKEQLLQRLKMIRYYDLSNQMWQNLLAKNKWFKQCPEVIRNDLQQLVDDTIQRNNRHKAEVIRLLDLVDDDSEREVLRLIYVEHMKLFDVADRLFYSFDYINCKKSNAIKHLANKVKDMEPFEY